MYQSAAKCTKMYQSAVKCRRVQEWSHAAILLNRRFFGEQNWSLFLCTQVIRRLFFVGSNMLRKYIHVLETFQFCFCWTVTIWFISSPLFYCFFLWNCSSSVYFHSIIIFSSSWNCKSLAYFYTNIIFLLTCTTASNGILKFMLILCYETTDLIYFDSIIIMLI